MHSSADGHGGGQGASFHPALRGRLLSQADGNPHTPATCKSTSVNLMQYGHARGMRTLRGRADVPACFCRQLSLPGVGCAADIPATDQAR